MARALWIGGCLLLALAAYAPAAEKKSLVTAAATITSSEAKKHVDVLADDQFEGREAGSRGGKAAAGYIVSELQKLGLKGAGDDGSFYQSYAGGRNILALWDGSDPELKPMVAESWEASDGQKTFTFTLRDDVKFADGTPLTAKDVVFSFERLRNLKGAPAYRLDGVETIEAPDDQTVVMTTTDPMPGLPAALASTSFSILNSKVVKQHGATDAANASKKDSASAGSLTARAAAAARRRTRGRCPRRRSCAGAARSPALGGQAAGSTGGGSRLGWAAAGAGSPLCRR